ncbi:MAG: hypothetical protein ACOYLF_17210, partial [Blastocatellia bacterium]
PVLIDQDIRGSCIRATVPVTEKKTSHFKFRRTARVTVDGYQHVLSDHQAWLFRELCIRRVSWNPA